MEKLCDETGLVIARLPAVDGRFSETRNGKNCVIPECIVRQTWDSSVNATFDATCMTNSTVVMSASERACALSHAIVWLSIDEFFSRIDANRPVTQSAQVQALKAFTEIYFLSLGTTYQSWLENLRFCFHLSNFLISPSPSGLISKVDRNFYLVLEDDALIREKGSVASFAAFLRHITESLPLDCELCYLGYAANWQKQCDDSARYHKSDSSLFFEPTYLWQLHGYLLSRTGARKLLSHMPIDAPVDNFVAQLVYEKKIKVIFLCFTCY